MNKLSNDILYTCIIPRTNTCSILLLQQVNKNLNKNKQILQQFFIQSDEIFKEYAHKKKINLFDIIRYSIFKPYHFDDIYQECHNVILKICNLKKNGIYYSDPFAKILYNLSNLLQQQKNMVLDEEKCTDQKFLNNSFIMFQILKKTSNNFKCDLIKSVFEIRLLNVIRHYFAAFFDIRHKNNKPKYNDYILYENDLDIAQKQCEYVEWEDCYINLYNVCENMNILNNKQNHLKNKIDNFEDIILYKNIMTNFETIKVLSLFFQQKSDFERKLRGRTIVKYIPTFYTIKYMNYTINDILKKNKITIDNNLKTKAKQMMFHIQNNLKNESNSYFPKFFRKLIIKECQNLENLIE